MALLLGSCGGGDALTEDDRRWIADRLGTGDEARAECVLAELNDRLGSERVVELRRVSEGDADPASLGFEELMRGWAAVEDAYAACGVEGFVVPDPDRVPDAPDTDVGQPPQASRGP